MSRVVNKDQYFEFGLETLAQAGFKGLNIGVLVKNLGVTSGSFYHHFGSWQGYVDALLAYWENLQVQKLRDMQFGGTTPEADVEKLRELTIDLHHEAEAAIRAWGANDESVRAVQRRVDDARRKTVGKAIGGVVGDRKLAKTLTSLGMAMLTGYQQLAAAGHHDDLGALLDEYLRLINSHVAAEQRA
ncbi:TetR/AcrR family transcriptional regulator [Nocardia sp. CA-151230]|uniref:TetR/AcrR family transcriptional regulator n=1 Tax=Nocardia sp. CA-151230 TaxID=3239982 RepID=UPI003D8B08A6